MTVIHNESEFYTLWGAGNREKAERYIYLFTGCGAGVTFYDDAIQLHSIVEGSNLSVYGDLLIYPFTSEEYDACVRDIESLTTLEWLRANLVCIVCDGLIDPDIAADLDGEDWIPHCSNECATTFFEKDEFVRYHGDFPHAEYVS